MRVVRLFAMAAALACGTAAAQGAVPPLRLCADPANLPFSTAAADAQARGEPGLYVEIGQAVADALQRPMETFWSHTYFEKRNLRTTLLANKCDLAVGLPLDEGFMGPRVIFSKPILRVGYALVVPKHLSVNGLDDLKGRRVAVQFGSAPQNILAMRADIVAITTLNPEEAMRRLAAGEADAAFIWGPSAAYINHATLNDRYRVVPVDGPHLQWIAAIGFAGTETALRDSVNRVLAALAPRIRELAAKYAFADGAAITLTDASPAAASAPNDKTTQPAVADSSPPADPSKLTGEAAEGREIFNGTCAHCHGPDAIQAERKINLRLLRRRYAESMAETYLATVRKGRPSKGMPAWESIFSEKDIARIFAFLSTVQEP
jgi:ABC-type amino acid transport substrate-binding protein